MGAGAGTSDAEQKQCRAATSHHKAYLIIRSSYSSIPKHIANHQTTSFQYQLRFPGTEEASLHHPREGHPAGWWQRGPQTVYHRAEAALALPAPIASFPPPHFHIVLRDH